MRKVSRFFLIASVTVSALCTSAYAMEMPVADYKASETEDVVFAEQTTVYWQQCPHCPRLQYRIWSNTFARWNTDWIYL